AEEIEPFTQRDLDPSAVFILDTFFAVFVWVGPAACHRHADVRLALDTAIRYTRVAADSQPARVPPPVAAAPAAGGAADMTAVSSDDGADDRLG
ncbi:hypothetical protein HK405_015844, partial [Cladochytrium tenue]